MNESSSLGTIFSIVELLLSDMLHSGRFKSIT